MSADLGKWLGKVTCGDCLEVLRELPDGCVDAVLTDPPYGIPSGAAFVRHHAKHIENWDGRQENERPGEWISLVPFADDAYCLEFFRNHPDAALEIIQKHKSAGLTPWTFCCLVKQNPPPTPRPKFVSGIEQALVSYRGARAWYGNGYVPNRYIVKVPEPGVERVHPTQKPVECMKQWLKALCPPEGVVLDPFCGSGATLVACVELGLSFIGVEIDPVYCDIARARIAEAIREHQAPLPLTDA